MSRSLLCRVTALVLTALTLAAHVPLPNRGPLADGRGGATSLACCCQPERLCTSDGACTTHTDHARAPIDRAPIDPSLPSLLAGNCGDPTPRIVPVSYDPVTQPSATAIRTEASLAAFPTMAALTVPARDLSPSVPPPRA